MDEFKKLTLDEQNENWNRCTPAFRSCVRVFITEQPVMMRTIIMG